jgi:hypothetical protein
MRSAWLCHRRAEPADLGVAVLEVDWGGLGQLDGCVSDQGMVGARVDCQADLAGGEGWRAAWSAHH